MCAVLRVSDSSCAVRLPLGGGGVTREPVGRGLLTAQKGGGGGGLGEAGKRLTASDPGAVLASVALRLIMSPNA